MRCFDLLRAGFAALTLALAACQPPPRPFASDDATLLQFAPENAGVVVEVIEGLPPELAGELRAAIIAALQEGKILASAGPGNRASFHLKGTGALAPDRGVARSYLTWDLTDAEGRPLADFTSTAELRPGAIAGDNRAALAHIVDRVAGGLELSPVAAGAGEARAARATVPVTVLPVEGAPGDGRESLMRALSVILRNYGVRVANGVDADGLLVFGDVAVAPAGPGRERVDIVWVLRWPDGREVGRVSQSNVIPAGLLRREWGQIALAAADGAASGIAALVRDVAAPDAAPAAPAAGAGQWKPVYSADPH